jgi:hypothetical protein
LTGRIDVEGCSTLLINPGRDGMVMTIDTETGAVEVER